jgi:phosphatidylserine/phosphatidylglycerophosphate/cardiolipin synthase-like enzyme
MRRRNLVALVVRALLLPSAAAWAEVKVFFSPQGGCDRALVQVAQASRMYLYAACYTFSLDSVADELIAAKQRGVKVLVLLQSLLHHGRPNVGTGALACTPLAPLRRRSHSRGRLCHISQRLLL